MHHQAGFSLLEILLSLVLGILIFLGILQVQLAQRISYQYGESVMRLQENAHLVQTIFMHAAHHAGYVGCRRLTGDFVVHPHGWTGTGMSHTTAVMAFAANHFPQWKEGTDAVAFSRMAENAADVLRSLQQVDYHYFETTLDIKLTAGEWVIVADCEKADLFQVSEVYREAQWQRVYTHARLPTYGRGAQLGQWIREVYYIGNTGRKNHVDAPIYALYRQDQAGYDHELVEGVTNMRLDYALTSSSQAAASVTAWQDVRAIKVSLLLSSLESVLPQSQKLWINGEWVQMNDQQLYQPLVVVAALQQRIS